MSSVFLSPRFHEALDFAALGHRSQPRKGTDIPYIAHPVAVACLVDHYGGDEDAVIAGLLHDLPEDTNVTVDQIRSAFGERVAAIVSALTENKSLPWVMRKRASIAKYQSADDSIRLVAGADKLSALIGFAREPAVREDAHWERFNASRVLQAWYYQSMAEVLANSPLGPELTRLTKQVFGWSSYVNPCELYLEYALRSRGERALRHRLEARTLWLNADNEDRETMREQLNSLIADGDPETVAQTAIFLGFIGKSSTFADDLLIDVLRHDSRPGVLAAALVASEVILGDAISGSPSTQGLIQAREVLRSDKARAAAVLQRLSTLVDEDSGYEFENALQFIKGN